MRPHRGRPIARRNFCPRASQRRNAKGAAPAARADKNARERTAWLKGLLRIRRYNQQETPYALQEVELLSWLQFGEAYSALRGWRPIPADLLSHSVLLCSGTEDISLPTKRLQTSWSRPTQGKSFPDKQRSIGKKTRSVKFFDTQQWKTLPSSGALAPALPLGCPTCRRFPDSLPYPAYPGWHPYPIAAELGSKSAILKCLRSSL